MLTRVTRVLSQKISASLIVRGFRIATRVLAADHQTTTESASGVVLMSPQLISLN